MKNETERLKLRQKYRNEVNPVLAEKHIPKDTYTFTDEYVFWLEEQLVKNIEVIPCCKSDSEQLSAAWKALEWVGFTRGEEFTDDDIQEMLNA